MSAPAEYRVRLARVGDGQSSLAPGFTVIIVADDIEDAREKAEDVASTLNGFRVIDVQIDGHLPSADPVG